jgi:tRNA splicing ligase
MVSLVSILNTNGITVKNIKELIIDLIFFRLQNLEDSQNELWHLVIQGSPGSGKTEVSKIIGKLYYGLGITQKDKFTFNHIACHKDWDRLIILGVNFDNHFRMNWIDKEDFINNINSSNRIFSRQQGGQGGENDDYMYTDKYIKLKNTGILQDMVSWMNHGKKLTGIEFWYESI